MAKGEVGGKLSHAKKVFREINCVTMVTVKVELVSHWDHHAVGKMKMYWQGQAGYEPAAAAASPEAQIYINYYTRSEGRCPH